MKQIFAQKEKFELIKYLEYIKNFKYNEQISLNSNYNFNSNFDFIPAFTNNINYNNLIKINPQYYKNYNIINQEFNKSRIVNKPIPKPDLNLNALKEKNEQPLILNKWPFAIIVA